jgi:hypothetical protein
VCLFQVAQMACTAVSALTKGNALNKTTLGTNGGAEALIATLRRHADITAVMEVIENRPVCSS